MILTLLLGCSQHGLSIQYEDPLAGEAFIDVRPLLLEFGVLDADEERTLEFTIWNVGESILEVQDLWFDGALESFTIDDSEGRYLDPEQSWVVPVTYRPVDSNAHGATVQVGSDDLRQPIVEVELIGRGNMPWLEITPQDHDFGELTIPCGDEVELVLQNVGTADLEMSAIRGPADASFEVTELPELPLELSPGAYTTLTVLAWPGTEGLASGTLEVDSTDPRGTTTATQSFTALGGDPRLESFVADDNPPVDLLFAVDQSGSMDDDQASLADNFSSFIDTIIGVTDRWRIGVVTYDHGCFNEGVITGATTDYAAAFSRAVTAGEDTEIQDDEALFSLVDRALQQTGSGDCNTGFLRSDAILHVMVISDEPERSNEQASAWTWDWFVDRFDDYPSDPSLLKISGVVDADDCNEGDDGYAEAIAATGGEHLSICEGDWAAHAVALAEASLSFTSRFVLAEVPVESSITVDVDGVAVTGWSFDASTNAVILDDALGGGEAVDIRYEVAAACE